MALWLAIPLFNVHEHIPMCYNDALRRLRLCASLLLSGLPACRILSWACRTAAKWQLYCEQATTHFEKHRPNELVIKNLDMSNSRMVCTLQSLCTSHGIHHRASQPPAPKTIHPGKQPPKVAIATLSSMFPAGRTTRLPIKQRPNVAGSSSMLPTT